jgi:D-3-phosphoglycerate dehydrogenase
LDKKGIDEQYKIKEERDMKIFSIFDDFSDEAKKILTDNGIQVDLLPKGQPRPMGDTLKALIHEYDGVIISTAQKVTEDMLSDIQERKVIATASIGVDHIQVPNDKKDYVTIVNAPSANRISVVEHIFGLMIALEKSFVDARNVSARGGAKSAMAFKPHDLFGKTLGVIGTGGIGLTAMQYAKVFGLNLICYSNDSDARKKEIGEKFVGLDELLQTADVVLVTLPYFPATKNLISEEKIALMKDTATLISISHAGIVDTKSAIMRAKANPQFKVGIDIESEETYSLFNGVENNIIITPHTAGGTVEARMRMFSEVSENICKIERTCKG